jgi:hypothetical protein
LQPKQSILRPTIKRKEQVGMAPGKDQLNKAEANLDQQSNF